MEKYNVKIEILTPVHIWNGKTISWIDYFCLQKKLEIPKKTKDWKEINYEAFLYKFKINKFINILEENKKNEFLKILKKWDDTLEIRNFIFETLKNNKNIQEKFEKISSIKMPITNSFYKLWKEKIIWKTKHQKWKTLEKRENEFTNQLSQLHINEFINSLWKYYIPWSSLKWTIRTILTNEILEEKNDAVNDVFKKLIVRDSNFSKNIEIWKLARQSQKWDWIYAEFLKPWEELKTEIIIKNFFNEKKLEKIDFSFKNICFKANNYTKNKIEKYIEELRELLNHPDINKRKENWKLDSNSEKKQKKLNSTIKSFENILEKLKNLKENECILNIWFWGWYWFKLLEEIKEKHPKFCFIHWNWEPDNWCKKPTKKEQTWCNIISWMPVKHLKDENIQIPRTNWQIDLENLGFIKLTFKD